MLTLRKGPHFLFVAAFIIIWSFHPTFPLWPTLNQLSFRRSHNSRPLLHALVIRFIFSFNTIHVTLQYFFYVFTSETSRRSTQSCFLLLSPKRTCMRACIHIREHTNARINLRMYAPMYLHMYAPIYTYNSTFNR